MQIERLAWDTDFFRLSIGKLVCSGNASLQELAALLESAAKDYDLVYVFSKTPLDIEPRSGEFKLVDRKVIFSGPTSSYDAGKLTSAVGFYTEKTVSPELERLAWIAAGHSRYKIDTNFEPDAYKRLYSAWIANSVNGKMADYVVCHNTDGKPDGMLTIKLYGKLADIGLVAVADSCQGKGVGTAIMNFAKKQLSAMGVTQIHVATQLDNTQACRYYAKQGLVPSEPMYVYHWWFRVQGTGDRVISG